MHAKYIVVAVAILLIIMKTFKVPGISWMMPFVIYAGCIFLICNAFLVWLKNTNVYIFPTYFCLMLISPIISSKVIFPYVISPRRFYAALLGKDKDPWHPPSGIVTLLCVHSILLMYLLCVSHTILKLISFKRCGISRSEIIWKYAIKMTSFAYVIFLLFRYTAILGASVDLLFSWLPFAGDLIMGIPMAIFGVIMLLLRYEEALVEETNGTKITRVKFWQNII